jgi:hypothetical protein
MLTMVVDDKSLDRPSKVALAEGHHSVETLLLDRAHEAFGVRIGIRRPERRLHDPSPRALEKLSHGPRRYGRQAVRLQDSHNRRAPHPMPDVLQRTSGVTIVAT